MTRIERAKNAARNAASDAMAVPYDVGPESISDAAIAAFLDSLASPGPEGEQDVTTREVEPEALLRTCRDFAGRLDAVTVEKVVDAYFENERMIEDEEYRAVHSGGRANAA